MTNSIVATPPPLPGDTEARICSSCGNRIKSIAEICPSCGVRQRKGADKAALALLAFFLGGFGAHKFYVGKYGFGILYLLFCWTFIPGLVSFIEFIIYLCTPADELARKYDSRGAGVVIAVVVGIFGFVTIGGILAAIAVPNFIAYRNKATCVRVESAANQTISALTEFYANPDVTHVPSYEELVNSTGLQTDEMINVQLIYHQDEILIQVHHTTGTCPKGENYLVSIRDEIYAEWR